MNILYCRRDFRGDEVKDLELEKINLDFPGGPKGMTRVLEGGRRVKVREIFEPMTLVLRMEEGAPIYECRWLPEARKEDNVFSPEPPDEATLWTPWLRTSDLQNYDTFVVFSSSSWSLVTVAIGNSYSKWNPLGHIQDSLSERCCLI